MLRHTLVVIGLSLAAHLAIAGEAGKVIFAAGVAQQSGQPLVLGAAVQEGATLSTGADGFLYVKTSDNGLFILRPNTTARIVAYHIDAKNPVNTRIKLELISGVARSRSGDAVKLARQNFRFNTPVAAIGVRGTDFTVFTDSETSRVAVISGGVVVSAFGGNCNAEGIGPCEGSASRELSAAQRGQLLQVRKGQATPQLLEGSDVAPSQQPAPRDAPAIGTNTPLSGQPNTAPNLDAQKNETLAQVAAQLNNPPAPMPTPNPTPLPTEPPIVMPPPVNPTPPVTEPSPPPVDNTPQSGIIWGRWQRIGAPPAVINLTRAREKAELIAINGNFALLRTPGQAYVAREVGTTGFALRDSDAYIYTDYGTRRTTAAATVSNGRLVVDFGSRMFNTSFDLASKDESFTFTGRGMVASDGRFAGDSNGVNGGLNLQGLLSNDKGGSAAYIFDGRIDELRTVNGATYWQK